MGQSEEGRRVHSLEQQTKFEIMVKKAPQQGQCSTDTKQRGLWRRNKKVGQGGASRNDACGTDAAVAVATGLADHLAACQAVKAVATGLVHTRTAAPWLLAQHIGTLV